MRELLRVETDRALFTWRDAGASAPAPVPGTFAAGRVVVTPRRKAMAGLRMVVNGSPMAAEIAPFRLFEQRDYAVYARVAGEAQTVQVVHRDPGITTGLGFEDGGRVTFGRVNFGSQIGRTTFTLLVDGRPELDVEFEVFPTKLDYATDYERLLADVQGVLTGLAFEYLKATFQLGVPFHAPRPTALEWLLLLRNVAGDLENALRFIAARPVRGLTREPRLVHAARLRRVDSSVRAAVRRGRGRGPWLSSELPVPVRSLLEERRARPTLDTSEHRWLAHHVALCRRRVGALLRSELAAAAPRERQKRVIRELEELESKLAELSKLEPLAAAAQDDLPPPGFVSLQLLGAPGYREAYRQCVILTLGLRIEGGPFQVSVKDLSVLYEYWCYLAVLQIIAEETGSPIVPGDLVSIQRTGLRVLLEKGRVTRVPFQQGESRRVVVTFNPQFGGQDMLIPQRPDILVTLLEKDWPAMRLVLDAKYRIDASPEYLRANGVAGPPQDALNVLHRYRDAILEEHVAATRPRRSVIEAVALFPSAVGPDELKQARLWKTLDRIGVGAIPALPENLALLREWLRSALARGGWELADRAPRHSAIERSHDWRHASAQPVLIGVLRSANAQQHLEWIRTSRLYYMPKVERQARQFLAARIALYSPVALAAGRGHGAVTHVADVEEIELVRRGDIETPWAASDPDQLQICFKLGALRRLRRPIANRARGGGRRVSTHRWSSMLALRRAREMRELFLETEPEWRLLETLRAHGATFTIDPQRPGLVDAENPHGRAWFQAGDRRARYAGASGFLLQEDGLALAAFADLIRACAFLLGR